MLQIEPRSRHETTNVLHMRKRENKSADQLCSNWGFDIRILIPGRFSIAKGGAKSKALTSSLSPGGVAYSRALKAVKS